jgi:chromate transporter
VTDDAATDAVTFRQALGVWARIGCLGFGGPAGQIALMHRELVERRRWISDGRFLHALNYCMLLPGPEAQQLAVYIGWLLHRTWGGIVAGLLFVLPGAVVLGALSWVYVSYGSTPLLGAIFFGLKAAVLSIVIEAVLRIGRRALRTRFLIGIAAAAFLAIACFAIPFPWVVLAAAAIGWIARHAAPSVLPALPESRSADDDRYVVDRMLSRDQASHTRPSWRRAVAYGVVFTALWLAPVVACVAWFGRDHVLAEQGWFFSKSAVVTFGGAYAVLAYVAQRAVEDYAWLQPGEMIDGLALAETTPGPLILVLQFVGFVAAYRHPGTLDPMQAAVLGAALTSWVTFAPSFLFIFVGAPYVEALRRNLTLHAALSCVTAAVVGVIVNLAVWFGLHVVFGSTDTWAVGPLTVEVPQLSSFQPWALAITVSTSLALLRLKWSLGWVLAMAAAGGIVAAYR